MAQQNSNSTKKRGPGRPPGSKNKPKTGTAQSSSYSGGPTKQEVLDEMRRRRDKEKRNLDVIWSITLFAMGLFLFFTVVMDTTGSFGLMVHDVFNGLFGRMAFILPFLVFAFAWLLLSGRLQHIGARTAVFSALIFLNLCILNSYRFIDPADLRYGFSDIVVYYNNGVNGIGGGAIGMELGSILAKLFGMPGLIIISCTALIISIFLVANTPISRFVSDIGKKREQHRFMKELEADEQRRLSDAELEAALKGSAGTGLSQTAGTSNAPASKSVFRSFFDRISGSAGTEPETIPAAAPPAGSVDIPEPFGRKNQAGAAAAADDIEYTQVVPSPIQPGSGAPIPGQGRGTLFGRIKDYFIGVDSETGETVTTDNVNATPLRAGEKRTGMEGDTPSSHSMFEERRDLEGLDEDYGYPGRRSDREKKPAQSTGLGLGGTADKDGAVSYGLDAHGGRDASSAAGRAASAAVSAAGSTVRGLDDDEGDKRKAAPASAATKKKAVPAAAAASKPAGIAAEPADEAADAASDEEIAAGFNTQSDDAGYEFPPVSLLKKDTSSKQMMNGAQLEERAALLEQTLNNFGVDAKVLNVTQGASVTRYEVQPAVGVKVNKITSLADDIALNLRAKSIRIEAPIPGKAAVGIEVENDKPSPVMIRDLIDSEEFMSAKSKIEFVVGKDISGNNIVADLRDMPHMLIAGATGSGKSVCINSIITSFLYKARPSELKLIMIDPKVVELGNYNGIPHMLTPVVTDPRKASRALAIAVEEMDKRYELFAEHNVKDLESYNEYMRANQRYADCKPQIVIIIDELADLMMAAPSEVENSICRLAQKARAAGMHLIVATQRPSVDVVTGLIKANIPSRIAFSVASQFDSRTILDMAGAEKLLGKGDMLFSPVGSTKPYRVQGPFISEKETDRIIKFVKKEGGAPSYDDEIQKAIDSDGRRGGAEPQDELTEDAIAFIFKSKQASVSMLQRRFRIGYNRAARIIDEIEEKGIIGPSDGSRPRQLLMTEDEYYGRDDSAAEEAPAAAPKAEPAPAAAVTEPAPVRPEPAESHAAVREEPSDRADAAKNQKLSNTQAMNSFNSLPEAVKRMVMDADSVDD